MRRIFITDAIQGLAEDYEKNLFAKKGDKFVQPKDGLKNLEKQIRDNKEGWNASWQDYADYVNHVRNHLKEIILLHPGQFDDYKKNHLGMLSDAQLKDKKWRGQGSSESFSDMMIGAMRYKEVRETEMIPYVERLGIKTCVYCNSQHTATVHIDAKEVKGGYELDHFKAKDTYPFLCISFFNLQPCCGSCNKWKSNKDGLFNLYTNDPNEMINPFEFGLSSASIVRYMLSQDAGSLEISFDSDYKALLTNHEELFHTTKLYEGFRDTAEELVWRSKINNEAYMKQLVERFARLFPNHREEITRFLYGFYSKESDIHKRPLTKLQQDIARQLKLI